MQRVVCEWNLLPDKVIHSQTVNDFKYNLDHNLQFRKGFLYAHYFSFSLEGTRLLLLTTHLVYYYTDPYKIYLIRFETFFMFSINSV